MDRDVSVFVCFRSANGLVCLNVGVEKPQKHCSECYRLPFVPRMGRHERIWRVGQPCTLRHVPTHTPSTVFRHLLQRKDVVNQCLEFGADRFSLFTGNESEPARMRPEELKTDARTRTHARTHTYTRRRRQQQQQQHCCINTNSEHRFPFRYLPPWRRDVVTQCLEFGINIDKSNSDNKQHRKPTDGRLHIIYMLGSACVSSVG